MLLFTSFLQLQDILHLGANISVQKKQTPFFFFFFQQLMQEWG